jgi:hypothetical protein
MWLMLQRVLKTIGQFYPKTEDLTYDDFTRIERKPVPYREYY